MSSLIVSNDLQLMMLEIAVENLFVPWSSEFDRVILKKTSIVFRMLDDEWTPLSPNRRDYRSYRGSNCENEKFYGGASVVFCVSAGFFREKASGVDVQLYVRKEVCKYFEMDSCQRVGFAVVPVDDLLNGIRKQIQERNRLAEHLSDFYKRQIISRSTMGVHTLLDENFQDTAATISLYIRISYLGKSVVTEIEHMEGVQRSFCARHDSDEERPYHLQELTLKNLQSGHWDGGLPRIPRGRLICRCEELAGTGYALTEELEKAETFDAIDAKVNGDTAVIAETIVTETATADAADDIDANRAAKAKAKAIKDKETRRKAARSKSRCGATIGIAEGRKRTCAPSPPLPCLQTYPLCCRLQPHPTCFNYCLDISPRYCYRTVCPLQYFQ